MWKKKNLCRGVCDGVGSVHELKSYDRRRCHVSSRWTLGERVPERKPTPKMTKYHLYRYDAAVPKQKLVIFIFSMYFFKFSNNNNVNGHNDHITTLTTNNNNNIIIVALTLI